MTRHVYYWMGCKNTSEFAHLEHIINNVLSGEADVDKMTNYPIYKTRINQADRLFWITELIAGKPHMRVIDVVLNHDYQKSKFLKKGVLKRYLESIATHPVNAANQLPESNMDSASNDQNARLPLWEKTHYSNQAHYFNQQFILFSNEQQHALNVAEPVVISGPAGSGKSCVLFEVLHKMLNQRGADKEPILYVAKSAVLAAQLKGLWDDANSNAQHDNVLFKSYDALLAHLDASCVLENKVCDEYFINWLNAYIEQKKRATSVGKICAEALDVLSDKEAVYQEFRVISAYAQDASCFTRQAYLQLGVRHSLFHKTDAFDPKPMLFAAYMAYIAELPHGMWDPAFYPVKSKSVFYAIAVDEALDLSMLQLLSLYQLATNARIYYATDSHQRLHDRRSHRPLLLEMLNQLAHGVSHVQLAGSYRCPNAVVYLANALITLKNTLTSGIADGNEISAIPLSTDPEKDKGEVFWIHSSNRENVALHVLFPSTECAVVTLQEHMEEAKQCYPTTLIYTPEQIKGLGYKDVICHRLFDDVDKQGEDASSQLGPVDDEHCAHIHRPKQGQGNDRFAPYINNIITAITRTTDRLFFVQDNTHKLRHISARLTSLVTKERDFKTSLLQKKQGGATEQDWLTHAVFLLKSGKESHAHSIFIHELHKTEAEFILFKGLHLPVVTLTQPAAVSANKVIQPSNQCLKPIMPSKSVQISPKINELVEPVDEELCSVEIKSRRRRKHHSKKTTVAVTSEVITNGIESPYSVSNRMTPAAVNISIDEAIERLFSNFTQSNLAHWFSQPEGVIALTYGVCEEGLNDCCLFESILSNRQRALTFYNFLKSSECLEGDANLLNRIVQTFMLDDGSSALHVAGFVGSAPFIQLFIAMGADVHATNKHCETPLYLALWQGHRNAVQALIDAGAMISGVLQQETKSGLPADLTPFFLAIDYGSMEVINNFKPQERLLLDVPTIPGASSLFLAAQMGDLDALNALLNDDDVNVNEEIGKNNATALLVAVQHGHINVVKRLVSAGANVNHYMKNGGTALIIASQFGRVDVVDLLIRAGADIDQYAFNHCTALLSAVNFGHLDVVRALLFANATVVNKILSSGHTAISIAKLRGYKAMTAELQIDYARCIVSKRLLENFTTATLRDFLKEEHQLRFLEKMLMFEGTKQCLLVAILSDPEYMQIFCNFLRYDAFGQIIIVELINKLRCSDGDTLIHIAAAVGCVELINLIAARGYNINIRNNAGASAIFLAVQFNRVSVVRELIRLGVDIDTPMSHSITPLHLAVDHRHLGIVCLLLQKGGAAHIVDWPKTDGETALFAAIRYDAVDIAKVLLKAGADVNRVHAATGVSPLFITARNGCLPLLDLFLSQKDVEVDKGTLNGATPLMIAVKKGRAEVVKRLINAGANEFKTHVSQIIPNHPLLNRPSATLSPLVSLGLHTPPSSLTTVDLQRINSP